MYSVCNICKDQQYKYVSNSYNRYQMYCYKLQCMLSQN